ncbi:MAG: hypothetical protein KZQ73_10615 [Candidatus Thiodiazotropha sp. (ex Semelilucina semeliformis)]|nr:hypothetical protein [Candidatus Thiodiazotropha sp. (ex Semelilucina semeliformis)]
MTGSTEGSFDRVPFQADGSVPVLAERRDRAGHAIQSLIQSEGEIEVAVIVPVAVS